MNLVEVQMLTRTMFFIVFALGYVCGVLLCWSLQRTFYGEDNSDEETKTGRECLYTRLRYGSSDVHICTPERNRR